MRLRRPTDFEILDALSDGKRNTGANIAELIEQDRKYVNTRLPALWDQGLLEKIGPHENSGLYEITPLGIAALKKRSLYSENKRAFEAVIWELAQDIEIELPSISINE
jgi:DNA-binding MarR family transcriptional regulator